MPLRGAAARIAENMNASLSIPLATSQRVMPVKVIDENRRMINEHRALLGKSKVSYTHIIAWAIVKALPSNPSLNHAYAETKGQPFRVVRDHVNIGIAVDVAGKDGSRSLKGPNIKDAASMDFAQFVTAFDDIISRARNNKLTVPDFEGTTISLTNPGTVGTLGSVPRLMPGQGAIIATGAIDYPAEYHGVTDQLRAQLGLEQGDVSHLYLRSSRGAGRPNLAHSWAVCRPCSKAKTHFTRRFLATSRFLTSRFIGNPIGRFPFPACEDSRTRWSRRSGGIAAHQRVPGARSHPDRRF